MHGQQFDCQVCALGFQVTQHRSRSASGSLFCPEPKCSVQLVRAGAALKGLTEDDMLEEHRKSGPRTKAKGKWLEQTIAETMVSMSEDLYDTDDDEAPFNIKKLLRRPSRDLKVPVRACYLAADTCACVLLCRLMLPANICSARLHELPRVEKATLVRALRCRTGGANKHVLRLCRAQNGAAETPRTGLRLRRREKTARALRRRPRP